MKYDEERLTVLPEIFERVVVINRRTKMSGYHEIEFRVSGGLYPRMTVNFLEWKNEKGDWKIDSRNEFQLYLSEERFYNDKHVLPSLRLKLKEWEEKYCEKEQED